MQATETISETPSSPSPHRPRRGRTAVAAVVLAAALGGALGIRATHRTAALTRVEQGPSPVVSTLDTEPDGVRACRMWGDDPDCFTPTPVTKATPAVGVPVPTDWSYTPAD